MSNTQYINPYGLPQSGSPNTYGGGGGGVDLMSGYRSMIDARRSAVNPARTPQADYPDGYLGSVESRREDRLLKGVQSRLTQRSYQRGVHKGDRIDPSDYYWKGDVSMEAGIIAQMEGRKWNQSGATAQQLVNEGAHDLVAPEKFNEIANRVGLGQMITKQLNPIRSAQLSDLRPSWR